MHKIRAILENSSHPFWVLVQQFLSRGFVAIKFLLLARLLGPESMGLISIALVSLAFVEATTELGLMHAVVQRKFDLNLGQSNALWTLQLIRGIAISFILYISAPMLVNLFQVPDSLSVLQLISIIPLLRGLASIGFFNSNRNRNFRTISLIQVCVTLIDLLVSVILIMYIPTPMSAIMGLVIAEFVRVILSHIIYKTYPRINFDFKSISDIVNYGKWIWANSVSSFLFNQLDKVLASRYLGVSMVGYYQMSQKMTQMSITDISFAMGQYLFPVFSKMNREKNISITKFYIKIMEVIVGFAIFTSAVLYINAEWIVDKILGDQWGQMIPILQFMLISASLAGVINVSVVFHRALGNPRIVTKASYIQLILFCVLAAVGLTYLGVYGLIFANIVGLCASNIILLYGVIQRELGLLRGIVKKFIVSFLLMLPLFLIQKAYSEHTNIMLIVSIGYYTALLLMQAKEIKSSIKEFNY